MNQIYVRFIGEKWNLISAAIRWETRSWCSHVELVRTNEHNYVIDVVGCRWPRGIQHYPYITRGVTREEWYKAPNSELVWNWMESHIGAKYDLSAIFGIALDADFHIDDRDICSESLLRGSEWAAEQIWRAGFSKTNDPIWLPWLKATDCWRITPRDLLNSPLLTFVERVR